QQISESENLMNKIEKLKTEICGLSSFGFTDSDSGKISPPVQTTASASAVEKQNEIDSIKEMISQQRKQQMMILAQKEQLMKLKSNLQEEEETFLKKQQEMFEQKRKEFEAINKNEEKCKDNDEMTDKEEI